MKSIVKFLVLSVILSFFCHSAPAEDDELRIFFTALEPMGNETVNLEIPAPAAESTKVHGEGVFITDGTPKGTRLIDETSYLIGCGPAEMIKTENTLYYRICHENVNGLTEHSLYRTDGTREGRIRLIKGMHPFSQLYPADGALFYAAFDPSTSKRSLWIFKGEESESIKISDTFHDSHRNTPVKLNGSYYFINEEKTEEPPKTGIRLLKTDGRRVLAISNFEMSETSTEQKCIGMVKFREQLVIFIYETGEEVNRTKVFISDGRDGGTVLLKEIEGVNYLSQTKTGIAENKLFFRIHMDEIWSTDGTQEGTLLLDSLSPLSGFLGAMGAIFYFRSRDENHGSELWRSDGTHDGTYLLKDLNPGRNDSSPVFLSGSSRIQYFSAWSDAHGRELWRTDGTKEGTYMVKDIWKGRGGNIDTASASLNGFLYFIASDGIHGAEMWRSDGTERGTRMVKDIYPGYLSGILSYDNNFTRIGDRIFFYCIEKSPQNPYSRGLCVSDGTEKGTRFLRETALIRYFKSIEEE